MCLAFLLVLVAVVVLIVIVVRPRHRSNFIMSDVSCHQVCDLSHPGTLNACDADSKSENCGKFNGCLADCNDQQAGSYSQLGEFSGTGYARLDA